MLQIDAAPCEHSRSSRNRIHEIEQLTAALARFRQQYAADETAAQELIASGESKPDPNVPAPELAARTSLALLLLNLDETLSKE